MERCASSNSLVPSGTKRPELDGAMINKGEWTGTKKSKQLHECQVVAGAGGGLPRSSRKRSYEYGEHEYDVSSQKLYKCNYWEDPAYAFHINFGGLGLARSAANDNSCERLLREIEAQYGSTQPPARST